MTVDHTSLVPTTVCRVLRVQSGVFFVTKSDLAVYMTSTIWDGDL